MATPEGRVKAKVKAALNKLGSDCWRFMPVQNGYGSVALDFLLSIRGRFVAIETKAPGKKLTPLQEGTKAQIEAAGGVVLVVWDETSLEIAMKIILALEFTPNVDKSFSIAGGHVSDCLYLAREAAAEERGGGPQHLCKFIAYQAPFPATGWDHGAPGTTPSGRIVPDTSGND